MRIKSYFDSSIQTAMRQARHEFGDDVMLVTSRIASPEFRYLGDFEVVFAVDDKEIGPATVNPPDLEQPASGFGELVCEQIASSSVPVINCAPEAAVAGICRLLADVGLEPAVAESLVALIRSCSPRFADERSPTRLTQGSTPFPTASGPAAYLVAAQVAESTQDRSPNPAMSMRTPRSGGVTANGLCPSTETSIATPPRSSLRIDCDVVSGDPWLAPQHSSRTVPIELTARIIELTARIEESTNPPSPGQISTGPERADFPSIAHETHPPLRTSRARPPSGLGLILAALGLAGIVRRLGA